MARQRIVTRDVLKGLPPLYTMDGRDPRDVRVPLKLFNPCGSGTWYTTEYDPETRTFFGFAEIQEGELGYFSLDELESFRGRYGLGIERDASWDPETTLADVIDGNTR